MKKLLATAALVGMSGAALAAPVPATLVSVLQYSSNGTSTLVAQAGNNGVWQLDTGTGVASMVSGTYKYSVKLGPTYLFTHTMTGGVIGGGAAGAATTWSCTEGTFGTTVGASLCGNYSWGENFTDDSTYTPTATGAIVTIGGDDAALGPPQSVATYDGMTASAISGAAAGFQRYLLSNHVGNAGTDFRFDVAVVPVPGAIWLFGSALGFLGVARRRMAA